MTTDSIAQLHAIADYLRGLDNHEDADYLLSLAASLRAENKILKASLVAAEERVAQLEGDLAQEAASLDAHEPTVKDSLPVQCPACGSVPAILEETTPDQGMLQLAFKVADESAVSLLECNLVHATLGGPWLDTASAEPADDPGILEAIEYLELRGMLERWPGDLAMVRIIEQGGDDDD